MNARLALTVIFTALLLECGIVRASGQNTVVLLPLDNISGAPEAPDLVRAALVQQLQRHGWSVAESAPVEEVLVRNRVRYMVPRPPEVNHARGCLNL